MYCKGIAIGSGGTRTRGFNLVEAAIVLGVVGLVIGGIWVAAASVSQQFKVQRFLTSLRGFTTKVQGVLGQYTTCDTEYLHYTMPTLWNDVVKEWPEWKEMTAIMPVSAVQVVEASGTCTGTQPKFLIISFYGNNLTGPPNGVCIPIRARLIAGNGANSDIAIDYDPVGFPELSRCWWGYNVRISLSGK